MSLLGDPWAPSGAPHVLTDADGRQVTITVYSNGITIADDGGTTQLAHVEETEDPAVIKVAGRLFRAAG